MAVVAARFGFRVNGQSCVVADSEMAFFSPFVEEFDNFLGLRGIGSVVSWKVADVSANWFSGLLERVGELDFWQTDVWHGLQQIGNPNRIGELDFWKISENWISGEFMRGMVCGVSIF